MERTLRIDPEFQGKIPPLTDGEFKQLEENILEAGRVYEPIVVWNGTIVDGHNRYKIVTKHPEIAWETREMDFPDKWAAFYWMYNNQLGRRNLTAEQRTYLLGKMYEARKHIHGETQERNNDGTFRSSQSGYNGGRISHQIAKEMGVGNGTVLRSSVFAKGIDEIRESDPELAEDILTAKKKTTMDCVRNIAKANPEEKEEFISALRDGKRITNDPKQKIKPQRADLKGINQVVDSMVNGSKFEYTLDHLKEQIGINADAFICSISNLLMDHADLCNENRLEVIKTIDEKITKGIEMIKERLSSNEQL